MKLYEVGQRGEEFISNEKRCSDSTILRGTVTMPQPRTNSHTYRVRHKAGEARRPRQRKAESNLDELSHSCLFQGNTETETNDAAGVGAKEQGCEGFWLAL